LILECLHMRAWACICTYGVYIYIYIIVLAYENHESMILETASTTSNENIQATINVENIERASGNGEKWENIYRRAYRETGVAEWYYGDFFFPEIFEICVEHPTRKKRVRFHKTLRPRMDSLFRCGWVDRSSEKDIAKNNNKNDDDDDDDDDGSLTTVSDVCQLPGTRHAIQSHKLQSTR